jgi:hypothetical protein
MTARTPGSSASTRVRRAASAIWVTTDAALILLAAVITGVLTVFALELWNARLDVPFTYWGDALSIAAHFKTVFETGWYEFQPALGAPYGQTYNDFPVADNLNFVAADLLRFVTGNPIIGMNLYFIAGFPLAAATAVWFLRRCGISRALTVALAVLFALAPYHFLRGEGHLFLASYFTIPIWLTLVLLVYRGERMWGFGTHHGRLRRILLSPTTRTLVIAAITATAHTYYAIFFLLLLATAGIARFVLGGGWRHLLGAAAVGGVTVVLMLANMAPDLLYAATEGQNSASLIRGHSDSEIYALKLAQLLLPWSGHRIGALQHIRALYDQIYPLPSEQPALGLIAAVGLVVLLIGLVVLALSALRQRPRPAGATLTTFAGLAVLTFSAYLFATVGGLSTIVSFFTSSIRGWNRISIVIALLCLAAVGLAVDAVLTAAARRAWGRRFGRPALAVLAAGGLLAVGYVDQTPANASSSYAAAATAWDRDAAFFGQVERRLAAGNTVLQLPYQPFPESTSATGTLSGDSLIPYLHTSTIRWSAGGIKGRPRADYPLELERRDPVEIANLAAVAGFSGILLDTAAMTDSDAVSLDEGLRGAGVDQPITSSDGRWRFYGLSELEQAVEGVDPGLRDELAERTLNPLMIRMEPTFTVESYEDGVTVYLSSDSQPVITVVNDTDAPVEAELVLDVRLDSDEVAGDLHVTLPDGSVEVVAVVAGEGSTGIRFAAPAGTSTIAVAVSDEGATSPVEIRLVAPAIKDLAFEEAVAALRRELGLDQADESTMLGSGP